MSHSNYFNPTNKTPDQLRKDELAHIRREKWREFWTPQRVWVAVFAGIIIGFVVFMLIEQYLPTFDLG